MVNKTKIRVHNPTNEKTRYTRNYNYFFDKFTNYLKIFFDVEENRYFENAHFERFKVDLLKSKTNDVLLLECEYLIENLENGEFVVLSVSDYPMTHAILNEYRADNKFFKKALISQYNNSIIHEHIHKDLEKISPWYYFQSGFQDLDVLYEKRKHIKHKKDKIYFRGVTNHRPFFNNIDFEYFTNFNPISVEKYFNEIINYKVGLSIDGVGEFCYRDVELMGMGIPMIRFEFTSQMKSPLIPNYHYISIDRPNDLKLYRNAEKHHVEKIIKRYKEVIDDNDFLEYIGKNARQYYENNFKYNNLIIKTFELLELTKWIKTINK